MSRIGRKPVVLPQGVTIQANSERVVVRGPKGELQTPALPGITVTAQGNEIIVSRGNEQKQTRAMHGLMRSLVNNMVLGVTRGYEKRLEITGTGYRAALEGSDLVLSVGFSHKVRVAQQAGIQFKVEGNSTVVVSGIDKHLVGQVAANIRAVKPPEPYKGKGIRYSDEYVRRKAGKALKTAA